MNGKSIFILGPSFGGKTNLINQLSEDIEDVEIINFELFYRNDKEMNASYAEFTDRIVSRVLAGGTVLAESTGHLLFYKKNVRDINALVIVVYPHMNDHMTQYSKYLSTFGISTTVKRSGGHGVGELRRAFKYSLRSNLNKDLNKYLLFNGKNYNDVLVEVKNFLNDLITDKMVPGTKLETLFNSLDATD